ncbi:MAG: RNB domain-containing ribonuclease, partial [Acidobacteriota bacterium]
MTKLKRAAIREAVETLLRKRGSRVLPISDIAERIQLSDPVSRDDVDSIVEEMERSGEVIAVRGKRYSLLEFTPYATGRIRIFSDGEGLIFTAGSEEPDLRINRKSLRGAMNGDLVLVRPDKEGGRVREVRGRRVIDAEVMRILQRAHRTVVGRLHLSEPPFVVPFDSRIDTEIEILPGETMDGRDGEMVHVEIERYPGQSFGANGRVIEVLGMIGEPGVDIEVVIRKYGIPHEFPDDVLRAADEIESSISDSELDGRADFRNRAVVTIDGETARDFDDAVEVSRLENGNFRLGVHIADVAHYVREGSILDREAFERGTSVYFPGRAVPMLPERLSNGICSLNPRVDRLTFSAILEIDPRGRVVARTFAKSVIRTRARMTYTDVNAILADGDA